MVFDKEGKFVDDLKREQFVLKVNGKSRDISFFDRVTAGSRNEETQQAAARGKARRPDDSVAPFSRGRTVFFFIDDLHLSAGSMKQTRIMLSRFLENELGPKDEVGIVTASGQLGFLEQLTDDRRVLQLASERLKFKLQSNKDSESPPMSEYHAMKVAARDSDVFDFFVDETLRRNPGMQRGIASAMVKGRATQVIQRSIFVTNNTLTSLKSMVISSAALPERKLVFFISDGFLLDNKNAGSYEQLQQVTQAAAAAGVVIYAIDARGLTVGMTDASDELVFDPSGRLQRSGNGITDSQDALNALATDTGGRATLNTNALSKPVTTALIETSAYYLLAWRPDPELQDNQKPGLIEVSVSGRPELVVRLRRGVGGLSPSESASSTIKPGPVKTSNEVMQGAIRAHYPQRDLPVALSLNFLHMALVGETLTVSVRATTSSLVFESEAGQRVANISIGGGVFDDQGKSVSSFNKRVTLRPKSDAATSPPESIFYNHFSALKPGIYQVRVAAVDQKQGRIGSATRWIEIPDVNAKALTLSSLIVGEKKAESKSPPRLDASDPGQTPGVLGQVVLNVDHRFARSSHLRFLTYIYNARQSPSDGPDLEIQTQVFREREPVINTPGQKIKLEGVSDSARLPYAAEVNLDSLTPGRYVLLVTIIDRLAKASAAQRFDFQVD
jgi:VWFA-related protein